MSISGSDIVLVVVSCVFVLLLLVGCIYFLVYFQHPDDKNVAWFPKIVVILGLLVSCINVLLIPLDVATQGLDIVAEGLFPMQEIEFAFFLAAIILFFAVIPFTYIYYEGMDDDEYNQGVMQQLCHAFKWVVPFVLVVAGAMTALYWFFGFAELPLAVYSSPLPISGGDAFSSFCSSASAGCAACAKTISFRVSPIVYIISIVNLIGFVVLVSFGGVGLAALPLDLILEFKNRPKTISLKEYSQRKVLLGQRAEGLLREGQGIQKEREEAQKLAKGKRKALRQADRNQKEFKQKVLLLEREFRELQDIHLNQGTTIIWQWTKLLFGLVGIILSFFWILHIILFIFPQAFNKAPLTTLLNGFFEEVSKAPIFGPLFYGIFAFYLLLCVVKGNIKLGFRFVFFTLYPMRLHDTMMNALLFNTGLILTGSLAVVQLCTIAFSDYARFTAINGIFYVQIQNLKGVTYIFRFYSFALVGFAILTLGYLLAKPYDTSKFKKAPEKNKGKGKENGKENGKEKNKETV